MTDGNRVALYYQRQLLRLVLPLPTTSRNCLALPNMYRPSDGFEFDVFNDTSILCSRRALQLRAFYPLDLWTALLCYMPKVVRGLHAEP